MTKGQRTKTFKEIELNGVLTVPDTETEDSIMDEFLDWVESNGWTFGGVVKELDNIDESDNENGQV